MEYGALMGPFYPVAFWLFCVGLPALWVGYRHHSWVRGLTVAAMVVIVPFGLTVALTACGGPAHWTDAAGSDSWVTHCVNVGAPSGYALGILIPLGWFRFRDRPSDCRGELRSRLRSLRRADRSVVEPCARTSLPDRV